MIINKDIIQFCKDRDFEEPRFHAVMCDPPYELGFMGKSWDSTGIAFDPKTWKAIADQCYPGAYLLAFGGTRTFHRIAVAIEDAGFEIRDTVMWVYGSGFPKSHNVGKAVDKAEGNERESKIHVQSKTNPDIHAGASAHITMPNQWEVSKGSSPWEGYGTALKPAWEPVIIARLPLEGTVAQNCQKYGSGALNIDGCRVATDEHWEEKEMSSSVVDKFWSGKKPRLCGSHELGRWPANLIHDGSDEVVGMFPNGGKSSGGGGLKTSAGLPDTKAKGHFYEGNVGFGDSGSAARFFYSAKVSKKERDAGLEGFEEKSPGELVNRVEGSDGMNSPRAGAGRTSGTRNSHPTLKPISLTTYLAKLILPPKLDKPRRLLVPFAGAGSEVIGALKAGWDEVVGVEQSKEYCEIAEARIKHWCL